MSGASVGGQADVANRCSCAEIRARLDARGANSFYLTCLCCCIEGLAETWRVSTRPASQEGTVL